MALHLMGIEQRLTNTAEGLASSLRLAGTGAQKDLWPDLPTLEMPVLVVTGQRDPKFDGIGDRMAEAIGPTATRARMPNGSSCRRPRIRSPKAAP